MKSIKYFLSLVLLAIIACNTNQIVHKPEPLNDHNDLAKLWTQIDSLQSKGMEKSALDLVDQAYDLAQDQGADSYALKAILIREKLRHRLGDTGNEPILPEIEAALAAIEDPVQAAILSSMTGELFAQSARQSNGLVAAKSDAVQMLQKADSLYDRSLEIPTDLALRDFQLILTPKEYDTIAFQTVDDLLLYRAINHYRIDVEQILERPSDGERKQLVLQLYQRWQDRTKDDPVANTTVELMRLEYLWQSGTGSTDIRTGEYLKALGDLERVSTPGGALQRVALARAQALSGIDRRADPDAKARAVDICEKMLEQDLADDLESRFTHLLGNLTLPTLKFETESVVLPNEHFLTKIAFQNLQDAILTFYKVDPDVWLTENVNDPERMQSLLANEEAIATQNLTFPETTDYHEHTTEVIAGPLPVGYYVIVTKAEELESYQLLAVSQLAFTTREYKGKPDFWVHDRKSGIRLEGVRGEWFSSTYQRRKVALKKEGTSTSGNGGVLDMPRVSDQALRLRLTLGEDVLWSEQQFQQYEWHHQPNVQEQIRFYTDRSIYRPGQELHFKGVITRNSDNQYPEIISGKNIQIKLLDGNYQEVDIINLVSNEFGSVEGTFNLPSEGLRGQVVLSTDIGQQMVRCEEYRRPTFEANISFPQEKIKLGDDVLVEGDVKSYAGFSVAQAQVKYLVERQVPYFYRRGYQSGWVGYPVNRNAVTIKEGSSVSDAKGKFEFDFAALVPLNHRARQRYTYLVKIDVTDINGETQYFEKSITLGEKSFHLEMDLLDGQTMDKIANGFKVGAVNHLGERVAASGKLIIYGESEVQGWQRERYWREPDLQVYSQEEFNAQLPLDAFQSAQDSLRSKELILEIPIALSDSIITLPNSFASGRYEFHLQLQAGQESEDLTQVVEFVEPGAGYVPTSSLIWMVEGAVTSNVGEVAKIWFASAVPMEVAIVLETKQGFEQEQSVTIDGWQQVEIPISDIHQGGVSLTVSGVYENRYAQKQLHIIVPWQDSKLDVVVGNFRDRTRPGNTEEVVLQVNGEDGSGRFAEVALTIYDAALDAIYPHSWSGSYGSINYRQAHFRASQFASQEVWSRSPRGNPRPPRLRSKPNFDWFGIHIWGHQRHSMRMMKSEAVAESALMVDEADAVRVTGGQERVEDEAELAIESGVNNETPEIRQDLSESLAWRALERTDANGNITIDYKVKDALTTWKGLIFAHDRTLATGFQSFEFISQKELILVPNAPRFLRISDHIEFSSKVVNTTSEELNVAVTLEFMNEGENAVTAQLTDQEQALVLAPGGSRNVHWKIDLNDLEPGTLTYLIKAKTDSYFDAVQDHFPVLPKKKLVRESLPFFVEGGETQEVFFQSMIEADAAKAHHRITIDFTSNPLWYAVQALPHLTLAEKPSIDDLANVIYAHRMAGHIFAKHPSLERELGKWLKQDPEGRLLQNEELLLDKLGNTPWLATATEEQKQLAGMHRLLDQEIRESEVTKARRKLTSLQLSSGAFPWIGGGRPNRFITQHVLGTLANLATQGAIDLKQDQWSDLVQRALVYLDQELQEDHSDIRRGVKRKTTSWDDDHLSPIHAHAIMIMAQLQQVGIEIAESEARTYFVAQAEKFWYDKTLYVQAMLAYAKLLDGGNVEPWLASLQERAIETADRGLYWKRNAGYDWHELPIEQHALLTRLFARAMPEDRTLQYQLQKWLLLHKQTNQWPTAMATTAAVQALLLDDRLVSSEPVELKLGDVTINAENSEEGAMHFRESYTGADLQFALKKLTVHNPNNAVAYGSIHWEYYADVDQIDGGVTDAKLSIERTFLRKGENQFDQVAPDEIKLGDRILVRLNVSTDRPLNFVQILDHRAAGFEPIEQLSKHHFASGTTYYLSPGDLRTDLFIERLDRGSHTFEYQIWAGQKGNVSAGLAEIQCVYAPEFTDHSQGVRLTIK